LGEALVDACAYEEADRILREALTRHSTTLLKNLLVRVLMLTGRLVEARELLDSMVESDRDSPLPYLGFADLAYYAEDWEAVRDYALQALNRASPPYRWAEFEVARRLVRLPGQRDRVIELLTRFVDKMPKEPLGHAMLGVLLQNNDVSRSQQHLATARSLLGGNEQQYDAFLIDVRRIVGQEVREGPQPE
jgi:tetratricopeptide (TPR) repeat protein